ncbi:ATPase [Symbioplanes lichenis]|uniref:ATPase n=1 Tax=Symbioplanes lichenis TaxID=1629072 RepID=UPI002738B622|nr:ATPase [Actinoplanes lichenis]
MTAEDLTWSADDRAGRTVMALRGTLTLRDTGRLRTALLKRLAEQPSALLVDLAEVHVPEAKALAVFTAVVQQAATWPGTPVLLCAPGPGVAEALAGGGYGRLTVCASVAAALAGLDTGRDALPMLADQLLPVSGASRHARDMVTEACARWSLPHLAGPASLVVSELVANVIDHAGTIMTLRISHRGRYLHLAVRDGSPVAPEKTSRPGPSGLGMVEALATHWGWLPTRDGKVVWATLAKD